MAELRLSDTVLRFLDRGISISVASSDRANRPSLGRALAVCAGDDGSRLTVLVDGRANAALVAAVAETGRLTLVLSEPSTHRSIQIKGAGATVAAPAPGEAALPARHVDSFVAELAGLGFTEAFTRALMAHDPADLTALHLRPAAVFDQTPGPRAGERVPT